MDFCKKYDFCFVSRRINIRLHIYPIPYIINHIYIHTIKPCTTFLLILVSRICVCHIFLIFCTTDRPNFCNAQCAVKSVGLKLYLKMYYARRLHKPYFLIYILTTTMSIRRNLITLFANATQSAPL